MKIIDNNWALASYRMLEQAYMEAVHGRIEPTEMRCGPAIYEWFLTRLWASCKIGRAPRIPRFNGANVIADATLQHTVWFHNPDHPEYDVIIKNVGVDAP